ncbi:hypothetical protein BDZ89DRAFT_1139219 [Hymenopellis radicata]|nr:hypothetical protein BDZ89DRAFT_1139219 [Hymenopellis radicata]
MSSPAPSSPSTPTNRPQTSAQTVASTSQSSSKRRVNHVGKYDGGLLGFEKELLSPNHPLLTKLINYATGFRVVAGTSYLRADPELPASALYNLGSTEEEAEANDEA